MQNSNKDSPIVPSPCNGNTFSINAGDEYVSELTFSTGLTIATSGPSTGLLLGAVLLLGGL